MLGIAVSGTGQLFCKLNRGQSGDVWDSPILGGINLTL